METTHGRKSPKKSHTVSLLAIATAVALSACAKSGGGGPAASSPSESTSTNTTSGNGANPTPAPTPSAWDELNGDGNLSGTKTRVVTIDKAKKELVLTFPLPADLASLLSIVPINAKISKIPGATIAFQNSPQTGSGLALRIPLASVLHGVTTLDPKRLPNGDPVPGIPDGELPGIALQLNKISKKVSATVYLSPTIVGIFINTPFVIPAELNQTLWIDGAKLARIGSITPVPSKNGNDGGYFFAYRMPADLARTIDDNL